MSNKPVKKTNAKVNEPEVKKSFIERTKEWAVDIKDGIKKTWNEDPKSIMPFVYGGLAITYGVIKTMLGMAQNDNVRIKDDVTGLDYIASHRPTNDEILELSNRMTYQGQSKGEALNEMGLLKDEKRRKK